MAAKGSARRRGQGRGRFVARPGKRIDERTRKTTAADGSRRGARGRQHHGLTLLRRAVQQLGARPLDQALDPQSPIGRALAGWRRDLTADLGGPESITTGQAAMVELAVRTKLILDSVDAFILTMESPVNKRRRMVFPVIIQRGSLARDLARFLEALGLECRARGPDLARALAERPREPDEGPGSPDGGAP
jgi:hypothetical protein